MTEGSGRADGSTGRRLTPLTSSTAWHRLVSGMIENDPEDSFFDRAYEGSFVRLTRA
ncbi:MAG TPA: hypothetical protein VNH46_09620 [Gemmatimonadales bacterium]|nr:hypothetical protein [Gemmatimonadales bacterium]